MDWIATIINGALLGGLYGLFGLGLALVFGVMRVVNLAHGEFIVMGAYLGVFLVASMPQVPPWLMIVPVALAGYALGWGLQHSVVNLAQRTGDPLTPLMLTFGLSVILRNGMVELFGADSRAIDGGALTSAGFDLFGLRLGVYPLLVLGLAIVLFGSLQWLLNRTEFGRVVRATADAPPVARLMGVAPGRVFNRVMGLSLAFALVAGFLLAQRTSFTPFSGAERMLVAFEVVIIGGLGSFWGALIGGVVLGIAQLVGQKFDPNAGPLYAHLLFVATLVLLPKGLAGERK
ncbi:branched-chain amino acid ABC transporter permease [Ramlibacter sp. WS9]|uniref:branched-chain amino acid ABC transporter permease n=1 Tax=Ramlibacter sp. WS9 TaxID=1882741 RepID=UPI001143A23B|nr:branched-chain amino acid ABC transporter permease [Ramlibacter sp. WS9]ROZ78097.1 branched-chain amino acid ABC transporter permease [Ramlibacter sp. WS9]HSV36685.1 branched-chain amino acid ABC transporter permease [Ramlibacter sp.]